MASTTMQSLAGVSSLGGIRCQLSSRALRGSRRNAGGPRVRAQAAAEEEEAVATGAAGDDDFDARLAKLQKKVTSGTGKKAELRRARKEAGGDPYSAATPDQTKKKQDMFIPPVPLKEPVSDGLPVSLGLTPYTERLHGRLAALGLAAVLLVELATGESLVRFHDTGTLTVQVYTILGLAALFVKFEKEKISVWPKSKSKE